MICVLDIVSNVSPDFEIIKLTAFFEVKFSNLNC